MCKIREENVVLFLDLCIQCNSNLFKAVMLIKIHVKEHKESEPTFTVVSTLLVSWSLILLEKCFETFSLSHFLKVLSVQHSTCWSVHPVFFFVLFWRIHIWRFFTVEIFVTNLREKERKTKLAGFRKLGWPDLEFWQHCYRTCFGICNQIIFSYQRIFLL